MKTLITIDRTSLFNKINICLIFLFMQTSIFSNTPNIKSFEIENQYLKVKLTNYGATIQELWVKNSSGKQTNVVLGFENPETYKDNPMYLASCIGRYAGRIRSTIKLESGAYKLTEHQKGIHLHGGKEGFNRKIWKVISVEKQSLRFEYISPDGEEGFPGCLTVNAEYSLEENRLKICYTATTDKITIVNLTNHAHFNLSKKKPIADHTLRVNADRILELSDDLMPTGNLLPVTQGPYDFTKEKKIGKTSFDTPFIFNKESPELVCSSNDTGITMKITTNQPVVVIFTPNTGQTVCFETQNYPDALYHDQFSSPILVPEEEYNNTTFLEFNTANVMPKNEKYN